MTTAPRFSVLVPAYNQGDFLGHALDSLLAQTCEDWEAVVVNDGSTDHTEALARGYQERDARIRYFSQKNGGCAAALNTALVHAHGQWVCWLSSDDLFEPDKLAVHARAIAQWPATLFFHSHFNYLFEATGEKIKPDTWRTIPEQRFQVSRFFQGSYVHGNSVCIRRDLLARCAPFDTALRSAQDFDMWLRLSRVAPSRFLHERTCVTRWHAGQTTNDMPVRGLYDSHRACINFLNTHEFREIFPSMNLHRISDASDAASEIMSIALWTGSYVYQLGYDAALLDRMREWLWLPDMPIATRKAVLDVVERSLDGLGEEGRRALPGPVRSSVTRLADGRDTVYVSRDPLDLVRRTIDDPVTAPAKRANLHMYLQRIREEGERAIRHI